MNMAISRSAGSAGGVWVGGVAAGGAAAVEAGGGARLSLEPSGLGDGEDDDQNQVMVRVGLEIDWLGFAATVLRSGTLGVGIQVRLEEGK